MEGDADGLSAAARLKARLAGDDALRRLGQALWMVVGSPLQLSSLTWAKGLLGHDGDDVLWAALLEQGVLAPPDDVVQGHGLARLLGDLSRQAAGDHIGEEHLVWTLPDTVHGTGVARDGYATAARQLIAAAQRTVTMVSPYLEAKGVGLLSAELLQVLHRGVETTVLTHGASDLGSLASAALEELRRLATGLAGALTVYAASTDAVLLHPKLLVVDSRQALLGSANITGRGLSMNFEVGVVLGQTSAIEIERVVWTVIESSLAMRTFSTRTA